MRTRSCRISHQIKAVLLIICKDLKRCAHLEGYLSGFIVYLLISEDRKKVSYTVICTVSPVIKVEHVTQDEQFSSFRTVFYDKNDCNCSRGSFAVFYVKPLTLSVRDVTEECPFYPKHSDKLKY